MSRVQRWLIVGSLIFLLAGTWALFTVTTAATGGFGSSSFDSSCVYATPGVPSTNPGGSPTQGAAPVDPCLTASRDYLGGLPVRMGLYAALTATGVVLLAMAVVLGAGFVATLVVGDARRVRAATVPTANPGADPDPGADPGAAPSS